MTILISTAHPVETPFFPVRQLLSYCPVGRAPTSPYYSALAVPHRICKSRRYILSLEDCGARGMTNDFWIVVECTKNEGLLAQVAPPEPADARGGPGGEQGGGRGGLLEVLRRPLRAAGGAGPCGRLVFGVHSHRCSPMPLCCLSEHAPVQPFWTLFTPQGQGSTGHF